MFPGATSKIEAVFFDQGPGMIMDDSFLFSANVVGQHILWGFTTFWTTVWGGWLLRLLRFMKEKYIYRVKLNFKHKI